MDAPKIRAIKIRNFKAFGEETRIPLSSLNVLSGLNSAGKSTVYQALLLIAEVVRDPIRGNLADEQYELKLTGKYLDLGSPDEIFHDTHDQELSFCLEWDDGVEMSFTFGLDAPSTRRSDDSRSKISLSSTWHRSRDLDGTEAYVEASRDGKRWTVRATRALSFPMNQIARAIIDEVTEGLPETAKLGEGQIVFSPEVMFTDVKRIWLPMGLLTAFDIRSDQLINTVEPSLRHYFDPTTFGKAVLKRAESPKRISLLNEIRPGLVMRLGRLSDLTLVPPFRGFPHRIYVMSDDTPDWITKLIKRPMTKIAADYDWESGKVEKMSGRDAVNHWMANVFRLCDAVEVTSRKGLVSEVWICTGKERHSLSAVGFGVSQLLPIVVGLLFLKTSSVVVVDEPEIHLHPDLQAKLAVFFATMAMTGKTIIIETHSDHFLQKMTAVVLERPIIHDRLSLLWVEKDRSGGASCRAIEYDKLGYFVDPPENFSDTSYQILQETAKLRYRKLKEE